MKTLVIAAFAAAAAAFPAVAEPTASGLVQLELSLHIDPALRGRYSGAQLAVIKAGQDAGNGEGGDRALATPVPAN